MAIMNCRDAETVPTRNKQIQFSLSLFSYQVLFAIDTTFLFLTQIDRYQLFAFVAGAKSGVTLAKN